MRLVELLARDLSEWPEDGGPVVAVVQDPDRMAYVRLHDDEDEFSFRQNEWIGVWHNHATARPLSHLATDHTTAIVTRAQWEAERAKLSKPKANADGWVRNRGRSNKSPVDAGVTCTIKFRDGSEATGGVSTLRWLHNGGYADVMRYKIHKPDEQVEPVSEPVEPASAPDPILTIRDRIRELDIQRVEVEEVYQQQASEIAKEREELVAKLKAEGLALVGDSAD